MKKYVNGQYIEMTKEEVEEWQNSQASEAVGGGMRLIGTHEAEEGSSVFLVPVGRRYRDVLIALDLKLSRQSAGYLYFDDIIVSNQTTGTFYAASNNALLWIHDYGGYVDADFTKYDHGTQVKTPVKINSLLHPGMPDVVGFEPRTAGGLIVSGTAKVYARI